MYIPTSISLGFYRLGFGYSESRSPIRSLCPCPCSTVTASVSASSPATGMSGEDPFSVVKKGYVILPICGIGLIVRRTFWWFTSPSGFLLSGEPGRPLWR